jgi:stage II sporulation protein E
MILELRRSQEQLRSLQADRQRQREYRTAVIQQYRFMADYLRQQADILPRREQRVRQRYTPEVTVCSAGREAANGDRCASFRGVGSRHYILLCDGMGTGLGAAQEGQSAMDLLRRMLTAGFPAEHALRSLNALLVLRGRAAAVTMDLAEIHLDSGRVTVYKWGAAPSYLISSGCAEKIGTATPPPGLSVSDGRESMERLSLRRGEMLILVSDGVEVDGALRRVRGLSALPPGELAAKLLEQGSQEREDDATVAAVRLRGGVLST